MDFSAYKPIYLQISDNICKRILRKELLPYDKITSIRELGTELGVNPNTIMRTYEHLQSIDIIFNKRGIGFFVSEQAREKILEVEKEFFLNVELPEILKKMELLEIKREELGYL